MLVVIGLMVLTACGRGTNAPSPSPSPPAPVEGSPSPQPSPEPTAKLVTVKIVDGQVTVSETRVEVHLNETVRIEVASDRSDEIHVHGYEIKSEIKPGETTVVEFVADLPGVFEVEIHTGHEKLFDLRVS